MNSKVVTRLLIEKVGLILLYSNVLKSLSREKLYLNLKLSEYLLVIEPNKFEVVLFNELLLGRNSSFLSLKTVASFASK